MNPKPLVLAVVATLLAAAGGSALVGLPLVAPQAGPTEAASRGSHGVAAVAAEFVSTHADVIGAPAGDSRWRADTLVQPYADGTLYASATGGVGYLTGALEVAFDAAGGLDRFGVPQGLALCDTVAQACAQRLERGLVVWSEDEGSEVVDADRTLRFESVPNFRDVAGEGSGLTLSDGSTLRRGVVYRSGKLSDLTARDQVALRALGITDIYDLRTTQVTERTPDPTIPGIEWHLSNLYGVDKTVGTPVSSADEAAEHMRNLNRAFVSDPRQRAQLATLLRAIAAEDGPVLVHCTAGKDRTGWVSAMLQFVAGAEESEVMAEYLKSNTYRAQIIERTYERMIAEKGVRAAETERADNAVDESYLGAGLDLAVRRYGSIEGYLTRGVGLSEDELHALRQKLRPSP